MPKKNQKIEVIGTEIGIIYTNKAVYVSLTDIAKHKNPEAPADIVKNWLRSKNRIGLLGLGEKLNIFKTDELEEVSTIRKFRIVQQEGKREVARNIDHYNHRYGDLCGLSRKRQNSHEIPQAGKSKPSSPRLDLNDE